MQIDSSLGLCFVFQLSFEEDLRISSMFSGEGECVPFSNNLYPTGNVEDWLLEVENTMRGSLREILNRALLAYAEVKSCVCDPFRVQFSSSRGFVLCIRTVNHRISSS